MPENQTKIAGIENTSRKFAKGADHRLTRELTTTQKRTETHPIITRATAFPLNANFTLNASCRACTIDADKFR
jgi:hypothetical protein